MAKQNRTCKHCGETFKTPQNLCKHENKKKPCLPQDPLPEIDPEAGPGPRTQAYREEIPILS